MYLLKRGLDSLHSADDSMFKFNAPDAAGDSAIFGHRVLRLQHIHDLTGRIIRDIEAKMDKLLFGNEDFKVDSHEFIHDDPRSRTPGWGFVDDLRNSWHGKKTIVQHIVETPELFQRFIYVNGDGKYIWKPAECYEYMAQVYDLQMSLFFVKLLTEGGVARGTELLSQLLRNIAGGSVRNNFVLFGIFTSRGTFNKTSHATHEDKCMVRIPLPIVGRLYVRFMAYLRPVFVEFQMTFRPHMEFNATHFFFAGLNRPMVTSDLSVALSKLFYDNFEIKMSLGIYRQFISFIISCNCHLFERARISTTAMDEQMGHSGEMRSGHYGGDMRFPQNLDRGIYMRTATSSAAYQMLVGHPPDLMIALCAGFERQNTISDTIKAIQEGRYVAPGQAVIGEPGVVPGPNPAITVDGIVEALDRRISPRIVAHVNRSLSESHAALINVVRPNTSFSQSNSLPQTVKRHTHPNLLKHLRQFMRSDHEMLGFTGSAQAEVTQLMFDGTQNIGYFAATGMWDYLQYHRFILPCDRPGSGKTTPGLLNAKLLDGGKATIWILPLKSMHEQYRKRSRDHQMTCETWTRNSSASTPCHNVLVTIENTEKAALRSYLNVLVTTGLVARVIVDEAHLAETQGSFRPVLDTVHWLGSQNVQIILQSASVPISIEADLFRRFGISMYVVCREKTTRNNISYNVIHTDSITDTLDSMCRRVLEESESNKLIIFCRSKSECSATAERLGLPYCDGSMTQKEVDDVLGDLRSGKVRGVVATILLGVALDIPDLSHVFHENYPYNMLGYIQEAGRPGRAPGSKGYSYVIVKRDSPNPNTIPTHDRFGAELVYVWANMDTICRRLPIQVFNDGAGEPCPMLNGTVHLCDTCHGQCGDLPERGAPNAFSLEMIQSQISGNSVDGTCKFCICHQIL